MDKKVKEEDCITSWPRNRCFSCRICVTIKAEHFTERKGDKNNGFVKGGRGEAEDLLYQIGKSLFLAWWNKMKINRCHLSCSVLALWWKLAQKESSDWKEEKSLVPWRRKAVACVVGLLWSNSTRMMDCTDMPQVFPQTLKEFKVFSLLPLTSPNKHFLKPKGSIWFLSHTYSKSHDWPGVF